jgi:hypothetical protein
MSHIPRTGFKSWTATIVLTLFALQALAEDPLPRTRRR